MATCHTDCMERPLRICFGMMGAFIGSHPCWFLIAPLVVSAGFGSGFYFLAERLSNNIEEQFTPVDGQAKLDRKYIQETFPGNDSIFSPLRLSTNGHYASVIATSDSNILAVEALQDILDLDFRIRRIAVHFDNHSFEYMDVCAKVRGSCNSNSILEIIRYNASNIDNVNLTYPWHHTGLSDVPLHPSLGGVRLKGQSSLVESANAIQLRYYLQEDDKRKIDMWLEAFINLLSNEPSSQLTYSTSMSMQWEFEKSSSSVISLFSITYAIANTFCVLSCWRLDNVRTKVWVAVCGVLTPGLAVLSGFGMLLLLGQPFVITVASVPFMIVGVGLDDMFIMTSCWQRTRVVDSVPDRLADTYRDSAISITITTLTDALALFLGYSSPFGSVRSFCLYAAISICFCYLYNLTFLGACMALNGHREAGNKHWLTCARIPEDLPSAPSKSYSVCCAGGGYDRITQKEKPELMSLMFERFYGPFLTHKYIKAGVFVIYAFYLAVSIYGCCIIKEGLDIKNLALDDSYIRNYYSNQERYFSEYCYNVMVAVKQPFPYWNEEESKRLLGCVSNFENLDYVNGTFGWFQSFGRYANGINLSTGSQEAFQSNLLDFLQLKNEFSLDINWSSDKEIQASRFFVKTLNNKTSANEMMTGLRQKAEECPVGLVVYHPSFIYFDQYAVILDNTIQTILVAMLVMLLISFLLIPSPVCSVWVAFAICSVIVGVTGFMSLWGVNLDSISLINLVMCIGFSVDSSAHVSYAFVSSPKCDANEKAKDALAHLGYPIMQGALSTILGVVVLSLSGSYLFRTFFKIVFLVITFGVLHGLMFIPVFLTILWKCRNWSM
ncbi:patched domain-containing protein 3 [Vanacampus margaritifer]